MSEILKSFEISVAKKVGTDAAIILSNIKFWVSKNEANEKHFHDGKYWTYNSTKAFIKLFSYLTESQIKTCLMKLEKEGYIVVGNYNKSSYDRTKWYSTQNEECISELSPMDDLKNANGSVRNSQPIPLHNTDNNHKEEINFEKLIIYFNKVYSKKCKVVSKEVKTAYNLRIKDGYSKEDIVKVIDNCYSDNHHRETNYKYVTLEFLSRPKIFERYASMEHKKPISQVKDAFTNQ